MPNGYRRGGTYTRNGKTYHRRSAKIAPVQSYRRWGFGGTDLAGLGAFLTVCEVTLKLGWNAGLAAFRGGQYLGSMAERQDKRPKLVAGGSAPAGKRAAPAPPPPSPLVFTLEQDQPNGWRKGDVQCKVHHSQRVKNCKGCNVAMRHQRWTQKSRTARLDGAYLDKAGQPHDKDGKFMSTAEYLRRWYG